MKIENGWIIRKIKFWMFKANNYQHNRVIQSAYIGRGGWNEYIEKNLSVHNTAYIIGVTLTFDIFNQAFILHQNIIDGAGLDKSIADSTRDSLPLRHFIHHFKLHHSDQSCNIAARRGTRFDHSQTVWQCTRSFLHSKRRHSHDEQVVSAHACMDTKRGIGQWPRDRQSCRKYSSYRKL